MIRKENPDKQQAILFTIGFTKKSAREFFTALKQNQVRKLIDVRLNNVSQLAGFTKKEDLKYFLNEICNIEYLHEPDFAPTKDLLDGYKKKEISWSIYEKKYLDLLSQRQVSTKIELDELNMSCLLCSEPKPDHCHRRLLAEYFRDAKNNIIIKHL
jgi:uncharacterized protein (DUF488 family)